MARGPILRRKKQTSRALRPNWNAVWCPKEALEQIRPLAEVPCSQAFDDIIVIFHYRCCYCYLPFGESVFFISHSWVVVTSASPMAAEVRLIASLISINARPPRCVPPPGPLRHFNYWPALETPAAVITSSLEKKARLPDARHDRALSILRVSSTTAQYRLARLCRIFGSSF